MKNIKLFNTVSDFTDIYNSSGYTKPWVSYIKENRRIDYNKKYIQFEDPEVERICIENFSSDGIGVTYEEAAAVAGYLPGFMDENPSVTSFKELMFFTGGVLINTMRFIGCHNLNTIGFPPVTGQLFEGTNSLPIEHIYVTDMEKYLSRTSNVGAGITAGSPNTGAHLYLNDMEVLSVMFPSGTTTIPNDVLNKHKYLTQITIPNSVQTIGVNAFSNIIAEIILPEGVTTILESAFIQYCGTGNFIVPSTVTSIGHLSFGGISTLSSIVFLSLTPPTVIDSYGYKEPFRNTYCPIYVPYSSDHSILNTYKSADGWSRYVSQIFELTPDGTIPE